MKLIVISSPGSVPHEADVAVTVEGKIKIYAASPRRCAVAVSVANT